MSEPPDAVSSITAGPSTTEDVPSTPGWVESGLDEILADPSLGLPNRPSLRVHRNAYLDCLADAGHSGDIDEAHDRCRRQLLTVLVEREGVAPELARALEQKLEALEAEISERI